MANGRILYIDPENALRELMEYLLQREGYTAFLARDGEEGFKIASSQELEMIIMELNIPDMNGYDLLRLFSNSHKTQHIPIIALTARSEESDQLIGFALGARDYVIKPFSTKVLFSRIKIHLGNPFHSLPIVNNPGTAIAINPIFQSREFKKRINEAFVLMPFSMTWSNRLWNHLKKLAHKEEFACRRADEIYGHDVLEDIWVAINETNVVIADVTGRNPNVMYEVGIAHTLGKNTILLTQESNDIPFDFRRFRHLIYSDDVEGFAVLQRQLPNYLRERKQGPAILTSPDDQNMPSVQEKRIGQSKNTTSTRAKRSRKEK